MHHHQTGLGLLQSNFARISTPWRRSSVRSRSNNAGNKPVEQAAKSATASFFEFVKSNMNVTIAAGLGLIAVNWATPHLYEHFYTRSVLQKLEQGVLPPPAPPAPLPREALRHEMRSLMRPDTPTRFFSLILGAPGTGKSTLVRAACREIGGGVGYMECSPCTDDFGRDLGETFDFRLEKHVNFFNIVTQTVVGRKTVEMASGSGKLPSLRRSCEALHAAGAEYRKRFGKPFVLVIDALDRLGGNKEVLEAFMEYAKDWAQDGSISCVFVASKWEIALAVMGHHPTQGRAGVPLIVEDVSEKEALQLLQHLHVNPSVAAQCVELVGGSLLLLERVAGLLHKGGSLTDVKVKLMELMALEYESVGLMGAAAGEEYENVAKAFKGLLSAPGGELAEEQWKQIVPNGELRRKLMAGGVLGHSTQGKVKFSSKLARDCAEELVGGGGIDKKKGAGR